MSAPQTSPRHDRVVGAGRTEQGGRVQPAAAQTNWATLYYKGTYCRTNRYV